MPARNFASAYNSATLRSCGASTYARYSSFSASACSPARRGQLPGAQISARRQRAAAICVLRRFRQPQLPRRIFRIKLRDAFQAKQRVFIPRRSGKHFRCLGVLLDSFLGVILFLLQERVPRDAFRRLLHRAAAQEAVINRQRFILVARIDQHIEQHSVINRREIRLVRARIQIPQRLSGLLVLGTSSSTAR